MFQKGFDTLTTETNITDLPVSGTIPAWLSGSLIRNGPAQFAIGRDTIRHWFDGHAMLHRFGFADGRVSYSNRYLQTPGYKGDNAAGKISHGGFATDPCRTFFQRVMAIFKPGEPGHNANVNLTKLADQYLALTETPLPVAFDAETLATAGVVAFDDALDFVSSTAHPHYDVGHHAGVQHLIEYGRESYYQFARIPDQKPLRREVISRIKVQEPCYVHSFGMTERYYILAEIPLLVNPLRILLSGKPFIENFRWKPELGTRFLIIDKENGDLVREARTDAFFTFHHINAFEDGDAVVLDISAYDDSDLIQALYIDRLRGTNGGDLPFPHFRRYRIAADGTVSAQTMSEHAIELPRINYRHNGKPYRYAYGASIQPQRQDDFINALVKVDTQSGLSQQWFEENAYPGEPVFVAAPDAQTEDEGVILSVVLDGDRSASYLLVLDAQSFAELGRASVPHHIPFGFHGQYFS